MDPMGSKQIPFSYSIVGSSRIFAKKNAVSIPKNYGMLSYFTESLIRTTQQKRQQNSSTRNTIHKFIKSHPHQGPKENVSSLIRPSKILDLEIRPREKIDTCRFCWGPFFDPCPTIQTSKKKHMGCFFFRYGHFFSQFFDVPNQNPRYLEARMSSIQASSIA